MDSTSDLPTPVMDQSTTNLSEDKKKKNRKRRSLQGFHSPHPYNAERCGTCSGEGNGTECRKRTSPLPRWIPASEQKHKGRGKQITQKVTSNFPDPYNPLHLAFQKYPGISLFLILNDCQLSTKIMIFLKNEDMLNSHSPLFNTTPFLASLPPTATAPPPTRSFQFATLLQN